MVDRYHLPIAVSPFVGGVICEGNAVEHVPMELPKGYLMILGAKKLDEVVPKMLKLIGIRHL